jgi:hypothetical protein
MHRFTLFYIEHILKKTDRPLDDGSIICDRPQPKSGRQDDRKTTFSSPAIYQHRVVCQIWGI